MMMMMTMLVPAAAFSFGGMGSTPTTLPKLVTSFEGMPGGFGWAETKGLAARLTSESTLSRWSEAPKYVREAELKHCRIAMIAALGFPFAEVFHPLFGGSIDAPSYLAFQQSPLQTFWPIVVGAIGIIEASSAITTFKNPQEGLWQLKEDYEGGGALGFDPLGYRANGVDLSNEELYVGRIALLGIAGMVAQELATHGGLF